ncbi:hypothetical protein ACN28S_40550 [Cystobacter fuscus]
MSTCLYSASGSTDAFAYGQLGVAAFTFEMGGAFFESCTTFENTIVPKNMPALYYAFKAARRPYRWRRARTPSTSRCRRAPWRREPR